ncbi:YueI family protein [Lapidilactobacillus wuchangensis]|uniref:YueI family protein n=1 Tax=Lapidilactobacillus wuchangensis TaxID=2486001 RepID=UPI000F7ACD67|nr:YueI family protein [Lapidilactobacillus wuchangensis]
MTQETDVNNRLNNAMYGTPQTLPDQRRQFLGSLRERVLLELDIQDLNNPRAFDLFHQHLNEYRDPQQSALINGKVDHDLIGSFLKELAQQNFPFTLVNKPETPDEPTSTAILIVNEAAVNHETVNLLQLHPLTTSATTEKKKQPEKKGFFHHLL